MEFNSGFKGLKMVPIVYLETQFLLPCHYSEVCKVLLLLPSSTTPSSSSVIILPVSVYCLMTCYYRWQCTED